MYALFRARRLLGSVPALIALVLIALGIQSQPLKIQPQLIRGDTLATKNDRMVNFNLSF